MSYATKITSKELHVPCRHSVTPQGTRAQLSECKTRQAAGTTWGGSGFPKRDESVDPGSEGLTNPADVFPFITPGRSMTTLFINSLHTLLFPLLHTHTCQSLIVCYVTSCSTAFLPSSGGCFSEMLSTSAFKCH